MCDDARRCSLARARLFLVACVLAAFWCRAGNSAETGGDAAERMLIDCGALEKRLGKEDLRVLDIRPETEHRSGHIPGAIAVPLGAWKELAGFGKARNYYCSFREWSSDEKAPLVEGE